MSIVFGVPVDLAYHLVCWLAAVLAPLLGGLAAAAAIIVFTVGVRLLLVPLSYRALRGEGARARLLPTMTELQKQHRKDPERLQRELAALQRAEGASLYAGCLPLLLQLPFLSLLYRLFRDHTVNGVPNSLLAHPLFGVALGSHWLGGAGPFSAHGLVFAGLFLLIAAVALLAIRAAQRASAAGAPGAGRGSTQPGSPAVMSLLARAMPFTSVVMAAVLPLAAGLYLLTSSAWTLAERAWLRRVIAARAAAQ